jgi:hypothetical protein
MKSQQTSFFSAKNFIPYATLLALFFSSTSFAKGWDIGLQAGPTVTKAIGKNAINPHADIGAAAEFFVRYNFTSMISLRTGVGFEDKGHKLNGFTITDGNGNIAYTSTFRHRTKYITMPLLVEFTFGKKVQPYFNTGLYMGFLISARDTYKDNNGNALKRTVTNDYRTYDMGYVLGAGIKVPVKQHWLIDVGMRNSFGFLPTNLNSNAYIRKLYNYSGAFNFGFAYQFGSR